VDFADVVREELREPLQRDIAFGTYLASGLGFCGHYLHTYYRPRPANACAHAVQRRPRS
jgi:hypothetical protein